MTTEDQQRQRLTPERVTAALEKTDSVNEAAAELGVHWASLYRYMREQGIRIEHERRVVAPSG